MRRGSLWARISAGGERGGSNGKEEPGEIPASVPGAEGARGGAGLTAEAWRGHGWAKRSSQVCARPLMKYCTSGHSTLCTERALEGHAEVDVA